MAFDIHQNEWMETYNAELTSGAGLCIPCPANGMRMLSNFTTD